MQSRFGHDPDHPYVSAPVSNTALRNQAVGMGQCSGMTPEGVVVAGTDEFSVA